MSPASEPDEPADELSAELRALYRRLEPLAPADELGDESPETARVVRWMQGAWNALDVPDVTAPKVTAPPVRVPLATRGRRRSVRRQLLAAAAVLLLLTGAALWRALSTRVEPGRPTRVAQAPPPARAGGVEILAVRPDQVELRSGPVRLVLLGPPPSESSAVPPGE